MDLDARFTSYVEKLGSVLDHAGRAGPLRDYCTGLILPGERKSVEPMAARTDPAHVSAQHQSLLHFVGAGGWSDEKVLAKISEVVVPAITKHGPIEVWIIDDTGLPKKGRHSVGVKPQYCGQLGKQANCQVAVSLSIANHFASLPVGYRLYLPKEWAEDRARRDRAGVPDEIRFKTKQQIALELIRRAHASGVPVGVLLMDLDYGRDSRLRASVSALGLSYVAGIQPNVLMWAPGTGPRRPDRSLNNNGRRDERARQRAAASLVTARDAREANGPEAVLEQDCGTHERQSTEFRPSSVAMEPAEPVQGPDAHKCPADELVLRDGAEEA